MSQATQKGITYAWKARLGLARPGKKISGIMPCTVIRPGDMADNILNRDKHPEWNGHRTKLVYRFPTNEKLWQRYAELCAESFRRRGRGEEATEFYRQNREAMDKGVRNAAFAPGIGCVIRLKCCQDTLTTRQRKKPKDFVLAMGNPAKKISHVGEGAIVFCPPLQRQ